MGKQLKSNFFGFRTDDAMSELLKKSKNVSHTIQAALEQYFGLQTFCTECNQFGKVANPAEAKKIFVKHSITKPVPKPQAIVTPSIPSQPAGNYKALLQQKKDALKD